MNIKWNGTFWYDADDKTQLKAVTNTIKDEPKCDANHEFNCTTCEHKKGCMPKEDLER